MIYFIITIFVVILGIILILSLYVSGENKIGLNAKDFDIIEIND